MLSLPRKFAILVLTLLSVIQSESACLAQVTAVTGNSFVSGVVVNTVTNDLSIDFTGQYTGSQIIIELTQGSIYQDTVLGSDVPPTSTMVSFFPEVEFDSFFALGTTTSDGASLTPATGGGSVNLGGSAGSNFDALGADQTWIAPPGNLIFDQTDFLNARITLSDDAEGSWSYLASAHGFFTTLEEIPIENGNMFLANSITNNGDYNDNGIIGQGDLDLVLLNWGEITPPLPPGWTGLPDGRIDQDELDAVLLNWGEDKTTDSPWVVTPEYTNQLVGGEVTGLTGDYNGSGQVEQADIDLVLLNYGDPTNPPPPGWVNDLPQGTIISCCAHLDPVLLNWGDVAPGTVQTVPEPSSTGMILILTVTVLLVRGRENRKRLELSV